MLMLIIIPSQTGWLGGSKSVYMKQVGGVRWGWGWGHAGACWYFFSFQCVFVATRICFFFAGIFVFLRVVCPNL